MFEFIYLRSLIDDNLKLVEMIELLLSIKLFIFYFVIMFNLLTFSFIVIHFLVILI